MARSSTGKVVAALTGGALAAVGFLAYQAAATAPDSPSQARADSHGNESKNSQNSKNSKDEPRDGKSGGAEEKESTALPDDSGSGLRVVYALDSERVWLVAANEQPTRSFTVYPSSASPDPGTYQVTSRSASIEGSDGVQVEHSVVFHTDGDVVFAFSAAMDGSTPDPNARKKTGAVREKRADGAEMWNFAVVGTKVVVVP